jgi:hypothetical protein
MSAGAYLESAARGGRRYDLVRVWDDTGKYMTVDLRRYSLRKVYRTGRVLGGTA